MPRIAATSKRPNTLIAQVTEPADEPFMETARSLLKAGFVFFNRPEQPYRAHELTVAQLDVLTVLARSEAQSLTCSEIAAATLITKGGLTGVLDRLEARGLVERSPSRDDRRSVFIRLSPQGVELFRELYPLQVRSYRTLFGKVFSPAQMKEFSELLARLIRGLEKT